MKVGKPVRKSIVGAVCLTFAFVAAGCMSATSANKAVGLKGYKTGTYTATAKGNGGDVTVTVIVEKGKILSVKAVGDSETPGIGSAALEKLPSAIVAAQSVRVDVVAGATITSKAVLAAAKEALQKAVESKKSPTVVSMKPGTYSASAKGYASSNPAYAHDVVVEVEVTENSIVSVKVVQDRETPAIMRSIRELLPSRIVESQSLAVDAIVGATASSNAIKSAVEECVVKAGGNPEAMMRPIPRKSVTENYDCDVVVVGAGTSGCSAAAQAADLGAKVILIEKSARIGGTGALSSETTGIGSNIQKKLGVNISTDEYYAEWQKQNHWKVNDPVILREYIDHLGEDIDWLEAHGFIFDQEKVSPFFGNHEHYAKFPTLHKWKVSAGSWNDRASPNPAYAIESSEYFEKLVSKVEPTGGKIFLETECESLVTDATGRITGVVAKKWDGTTVNVMTKGGVILATGGYGGNPDLNRKYMGTYFPLFGLMQNDGRGHEMLMKAGAVPLNPVPTAHFVAVGGRLSGFNEFDTNLLFAVITDGALMDVNKYGARISDESGQFKSFMEYSNYRCANGGVFYKLLSQKQVDALVTKGAAGLGAQEFGDTFAIDFLGYTLGKDEKMTNLQAVLDAAVIQGIVFKGSTLEELAENAGMDPWTLKTNVEKYDAMCRAGKDTQFGKTSRLMNEIGKGPYYAVRAQPFSYSTLGDVDVNAQMQVIRENGKGIPGLYAVGAESFGVLTDGVAYPDLGGPATSWGFYSGRTAAKAVCEGL